MSKRSIMSICVVLALSVASFAQVKPDPQGWTVFWRAFTKAVNPRSKPAVKRLMSSEQDFFSGGGMEDRDGWLRLADEYRWWPSLQRSVRTGTKADPGNSGETPARVTRDGRLCFHYIRGRWRFTGPMGD